MPLGHVCPFLRGPENTEISSEDRAILAIAGFVCFISLLSGMLGVFLASGQEEDRRNGCSEHQERPRQPDKSESQQLELDCVCVCVVQTWAIKDVRDVTPSPDRDEDEPRHDDNKKPISSPTLHL
jgi:hypothetical protein